MTLVLQLPIEPRTPPSPTPVPADPPSDWTPQFLLEYGRNTREAYASDLKRFFAFCEAVGEMPQKATRAVCAAFSRHETELTTQSTATVSRRLSTLSSWMAYGASEGYIESNPMSAVRRPRMTKQVVSTGLDKDELSAFVATAKEDGMQSYALILLLGKNGLRISEALAANIEDLGVERGHTTLKIRRKGGKETVIPLNPITAGAMARQVVGRDVGPIFRAGEQRMTRQGAWRLVRKLARRSMPEKADQIHPHSFRHSFATQSLDAGAPLHVVQSAMDHADPRTTQLYNHSRMNLDDHPTFLLGD